MPDDQYEKRIATRIDEIRAGKKISQSQLAKALNVSQSGLSQRLSGRVPFRIMELRIVASELGVAITDLLPAEPELVSGTPTK